MPELWQTVAALGLGIGPALAAVFYALRGYDRPYFQHTLFDDRRVFFALAVGLVLGTVSFALSIAILPRAGDWGGFLGVMLLVAVFEEGFKLVYLNRRGYRARFDTVFVGVALGGGIAAMNAFAAAWRGSAYLGNAGTAAALLGYSATLALTHVFTGGLVGFGCAFGDTFPRFGKVVVARAAHAALVFPFFFAAPAVDAVALLSLAATALLSLALYRFAILHLLPDAVPETVRRERRRKSRARALKE